MFSTVDGQHQRVTEWYKTHLKKEKEKSKGGRSQEPYSKQHPIDFSSPYSFCKQFMRRSRKCASEFLVGLCNPIVSCNTYEKLCNGYLGGKDRSARLTGIPNMDS